MAKLSARRAALAGFRLAARRPFAVLAWGVVYFCLALLPAVLIARLLDGQAFLDAPVAVQIKAVQGVLKWTVFLASAVLYAAVFRAVLRPAGKPPASLGLGMPELRQFFLLLCRTALLFALIIAAALVALLLALLARLAPTPYVVWLQAADLLTVTVGAVWVWVRLSMAPAMTFGQDRFRLFESWAFTRGRAWTLFWLGVISMVMAALADVCGLICVLGMAELAAELAKWNAPAIAAALTQPANLFVDAPFLIAGGLAVSIISALVMCVTIAPWAEAYRVMAGLPEEAPPQPAPERFAARSIYAPVPGAARLPVAWSTPAVLLLLVSFAMGAVTVGLVIVLAALRLGGVRATTAGMERWLQGLGLTGLLDVLIITVILLWTRAAERRPLISAGFTRGPRLQDVAWFPVGLAWALLLGLALAGGGDASHVPPATAIPPNLLVQAPVILAIVVGLAFTEEVMFRGWLLSALAPRIGPVLALFASSVMFAALHVLPWELADPARLLSFISYVMTGVTLGSAALSQRQIWSSTALHAGYNSFIVFTAMLIQGSTPQGVWSQVVDQHRGADQLDQALILLAVNAAVALLLFVRWRVKLSKAPRARPAAASADQPA
jgi:membrane protease YdiL (CAAX protease family)